MNVENVFFTQMWLMLAALASNRRMISFAHSSDMNTSLAIKLAI